MNKSTLLLVSCLWFSVSNFAFAQELKQTEKTLTIKTELNYLLYLPEGYEKESAKKWPLMLFLHGSGERGNNELDLVKKWGLPKLVEEGRQFPFILVSPQCPAGNQWDVEHLNQLLDKVAADHDVDEKRIYLTGLSIGGYGAWAMAARFPDKFAAVAAICGGGDPGTAEKLLDIPIWAFHGDADKAVPLSETMEMVDAIEAKGGKKIKLTVYEGVGHNSWSPTYANEELFKWFLNHSK